MEHHACGTTNEDMIKRVHGGEDKQVPRTHTHTTLILRLGLRKYNLSVIMTRLNFRKKVSNIHYSRLDYIFACLKAITTVAIDQ